MTTSPGTPGNADADHPRVPPDEDPAEVDPEMMQGGDAGKLEGDRGRGRGHRPDEDDEDEAARRNVGG